MLWTCVTYGQKYFEKSYAASEIEHVVIDNFRGNINVVRSSSNQIKIIADLESIVNDKTLKLKEHKDGNLVYLYIENPCKQKLGKFDPQNPFNYSRSVNNCDWNGDELSFPQLSYTVEIPDGVNIYAATVMDSKINIADVTGNVYASNVNGPVEMKNVSNVLNGTTVNGDIDIYYNDMPGTDAQFSTINGEINLYVSPDASIKTRFKSYMGELYTDLDAVQMLNKQNKSGKLEAGEMLKIDEYSEAKIGSGEISMTIETFNGNAYLKKSK